MEVHSTAMTTMLFQDEAIEECTSDVKSEMTCKSSEEADSGDEIPFASPDAQIHEIRCGLLTAKLHMQHFTCPGIHRKCIEFEGKLISPRQFTIRAEKDKQKDWKGSIRLGRYNLRTLMELKHLDFYNHAESCSLKCQSRNYIKNRKSDGDPLKAECDDVVTDPPSVISSRKGSSVLEDYVQQLKTAKGGTDLGEMGLHPEDFHVNLNFEEIVSNVLKNNNNNNTLSSNLNHTEKLSASPPRRSSADFGGHNPSDVADLLAISQAAFAYANSGTDTAASPSSSTAPTSAVESPALGGNKYSISAGSPLNGSLHHHSSGNIDRSNSSPKARSSPSNNSNNSQNYCNNNSKSHSQQTQNNTSSQASKWPSIINRCLPVPLSASQQQPQSQQSATTLITQTTAPAAVAHPPARTSTDDAALVILLQSVLAESQKAQQQQQQRINTSAPSLPPPQSLTAQTLRLLVNNNCHPQQQQQQSLPAGLIAQPSVSSANGQQQQPTNNFLKNLALLSNFNNNNNSTVFSQQQQPTVNGGLNLAGLTAKQTSPFLKPLNSTPLSNGTSTASFQQQRQLQELLVAAGLQKPTTPVQRPILPSMTASGDDSQPLSANGIRHFMDTNAVSFWSQMRELGILEDLLNILITTVDELKQLYLTGNPTTEEFAAQKLSAVTNVLDLGEIFSAKIREHQLRTTLESNLIHKELQAILDLKRNAEEQKRRLETAKRKTTLLDALHKANGAGAKEEVVEGVDCKRMHLA